MPKLTEEMKAFIVTELAQFRGFAEVARKVSAEFGVPVDRFQVRSYHPHALSYSASEQWRLFFEAARTRYINDVQAIPIFHRAYRLNELQHIFDRARESGNLVMACATLEQAAKEVGNSLTNERNINVDRRSSPLSETTPEERRAMVAEMLRNAFDAHAKNKASN